MTELTTRRRWLALYVLCLADLMIVLDSTIVNVALPSIRNDLGFSEASLAWVVNAYLLTFGGFLLLAGRLGDLYGQRVKVRFREWVRGQERFDSTEALVEQMNADVEATRRILAV